MESGGSPPFRDHRAFYLTSVTVSDGVCCLAQSGRLMRTVECFVKKQMIQNDYNVRFAIANRLKTRLVVMVMFIDLFLFCLNKPCANPIVY